MEAPFLVQDWQTGNAAATNLSLILAPPPDAVILNITNTFSTTDVILPQYNNTILEPGSNKTINHPGSNNQPTNQPPLEIRIPKLIDGDGSTVVLRTFIERSYALHIYAVYDQGSDFLMISSGDQVTTTQTQPLNLTAAAEEFKVEAGYYIMSLFSPGLVIYYVVFFSLLASAILLYKRPLKRLNALLSRIVENIIKIRGILRDDPNNNSPFIEYWSQLSDKERIGIKNITNMNDFLIIDDFYSELRRRNLFVLSNRAANESDLSRANTLSTLNESLLTAAENALNKIEWNKYR